MQVGRSLHCQTRHPGRFLQGLEPSAAAEDVQRQGEEHQRGWGSLDKGLLPLIASKLQGNEQRDLGPARLACRQWATELPQGCSWLEVELNGPAGWGQRFCGLQKITWVGWANAGPSWPKLKTHPPPIPIPRLERCRDGDLQILKKHPSLTSLNFTSFSIMDAGLKELSHLSTLTMLSMLSCLRITDAGLKELGHLSSLTSLNVSHCGKITGAGLKELGHLSSLTSLDLEGCGAQGAIVFVYTHLSQPAKLPANHRCGAQGARAHVLPYLYQHDMVLQDYGCWAEGARAPVLPYLPQLERLRQDIMDAGLKELGHVSSLTSLDLAGCDKITDSGLKNLGRHLSSLTSLNLRGCRLITDAGLKELLDMAFLTSLNMSHCYNITDAGLEGLEHMSAPTSLDLQYCRTSPKTA